MGKDSRGWLLLLTFSPKTQVHLRTWATSSSLYPHYPPHSSQISPAFTWDMCLLLIYAQVCVEQTTQDAGQAGDFSHTWANGPLSVYLQQRANTLAGEELERGGHQPFSQVAEFSDSLGLQAVLTGQACHQDAQYTLPSLLPATPHQGTTAHHCGGHACGISHFHQKKSTWRSCYLLTTGEAKLWGVT